MAKPTNKKPGRGRPPKFKVLNPLEIAQMFVSLLAYCQLAKLGGLLNVTRHSPVNGEEKGRLRIAFVLDFWDEQPIAETLEKVCVDTVEAGFMTKDLALLVGPDQQWLSTTGFLDKIDDNLKKAMTA